GAFSRLWSGRWPLRRPRIPDGPAWETQGGRADQDDGDSHDRGALLAATGRTPVVELLHRADIPAQAAKLAAGELLPRQNVERPAAVVELCEQPEVAIRQVPHRAGQRAVTPRPCPTQTAATPVDLTPAKVQRLVVTLHNLHPAVQVVACEQAEQPVV